MKLTLLTILVVAVLQLISQTPADASSCPRARPRPNCRSKKNRFIVIMKKGKSKCVRRKNCWAGRDNGVSVFRKKPDCKKQCLDSGPCGRNPCRRGERCVPEPKACIRAPCPQYRCEGGGSGGSCPANAERLACGSGCGPDNCNSPDPALRICRAVCVDDCFCQQGYVFQDSSNQKCILKESCVKCPSNSSFKECGSACPPSCDSTSRICTKQCVQECQCDFPYVKDANSRCILPSECPGRKG